METDALKELIEEADVSIHLLVRGKELYILADKGMDDNTILENLSMFTSYLMLLNLDKPTDTMLQ